MFYPENQVDLEEMNDQDKIMRDETIHNKNDNIRIYILNMLLNSLKVFKSIPEKVISEMLEFLIDKTYGEQVEENEKKVVQELAENKLFGFVETLSKLKPGNEGRPGYMEEG